MRKFAFLPGALMVVAAVLWAALTLRWTVPAAVLGGGGLLALAVGLAANWRGVREWFGDPRGVFALNTALSTLLLVAAAATETARAIAEREGLEVRLQYDTALFEGATIERLLGHYGRLLAGAVAAPETPISRLPLLTEAERQQILADWSGSGVQYSESATLTRLFEEQARRTPGAVAITFETAHLTYAALNARANQLASYLRRHGVGRGTLVGICRERSLDLVVAILGVLKAGGAYVPLDPDSPPARLGFMVEDAGLRVVVADSSTADRLPASNVLLILLWPTRGGSTAGRAATGRSWRGCSPSCRRARAWRETGCP